MISKAPVRRKSYFDKIGKNLRPQGKLSGKKGGNASPLMIDSKQDFIHRRKPI
jgi:hypothetical protein